MGDLAMFSAVSGMRSDSNWLDMIGNNISGLSTIGFQSGSITFENQFTQTLFKGSNDGFSSPCGIGQGTCSRSLGHFPTDTAQMMVNSTGLSFMGGSNMDLIKQLTDMILAQRGFLELNARVVSTASHTEQILTNLGQ